MQQPDNQKTLIGHRLRVFRDQIGIKQGELAKKLNIEQGTLSGIERGMSYISAKAAYILVETYNLSINWLIAGRGEMFIPSHNEVDDIELIKKVSDEYGDEEVKLFHVNEDSMEPYLMIGDVVACKKLKELDSKKMYVVISTNDNMQISFVLEHPEGFILIPNNMKEYDTELKRKDEIKLIYQVDKIIKSV